MVCFYHCNVPYLRISDLFTDKYTYLQVSVKSLSFIIHEIFDTNLYCIYIIEIFFVTLVALFSRYLNYLILTALMLQTYSIA